MEKFNEIMPECYIDSTLVSSLLDAKINHKHSCNEVVREMQKGKYKDAFAVGIIDNDKRKHSYIYEFEEIGKTDNLTFLRHREKHQYIIKIGKEHKAMETFVKANVEAIGMKMEDFNLPSDIKKLTEITKDHITTLKDPKILKVCSIIHQSKEVTKLQTVLKYLVDNKYNSNIKLLREIINN